MTDVMEERISSIERTAGFSFVIAAAVLGTTILLQPAFPDVNKTGAVLQAYLDAGSSDTVRSRCYTGKPARMLRNEWTAAWEDPAGPGPLGMPLQNILTSEANSRIARSSRKDLQFAPVGQIVGRMNQVQPVRDVMYALVEEYIETVERLQGGLQ